MDEIKEVVANKILENESLGNGTMDEIE